MSDVERIVNTNYERACWAREVEEQCREAQRAAVKPQGGRKKRSQARYRAVRQAAMACAMFSGGGAAFVGIGLATNQLLTLGLGTLVMIVFLSAGARLEALARSI